MISLCLFPKQCLHWGVLADSLVVGGRETGCRPGVRWSVFYGNYHTKWNGPSKTHSKIDILRELLHFSWEVYHFLLPGWFWSPKPPELPLELPRAPPGLPRNTVWGLALGSYIYDIYIICNMIYIYIYIVYYL